jgi:predicted aconitase with swiveling domain
MTEITSDLIRDLSVKAVEGFMNQKVPLSVGIAKEASAMGFNSEQVKRSVEATNCIAYLKMLGMAEDRTFEFPVADYKEVLAHMVMPEGAPEELVGPEFKEVQASAPMEKAASTQEMSNEEFLAMLSKEAQQKFLMTESSSNKVKLEHLSGYSSILAEKLVKQAQAVSKDPQCMDKLASVTDENQFAQLSYLVAGEVKKYRNLGNYGMFKEASLRNVKELAELHKEAGEVVAELKQRRDIQSRMDGLLKQAAAPVKPQVQPTAARAALGSTVAASKLAGSAVGSGVAKAVKTIAKAPAAIVKHPKLLAGLAAGPVVDDLFYSPGTDPSTGRPNDVWAALHG